MREQTDQDRERLKAVAEGIRMSDTLGRSATLRRLFDFLLERSLAGETPKEIEVATSVFGRSGADLLVDASVRVYVHRLRRKLDDHYAGPGKAESERLTIPKGEYRFQLVQQGDDPHASMAGLAGSKPGDATTPRPRAARWPWLFLAIGLLLGAALAAAAILLFPRDDGFAAIRRAPPWAMLLDSRKPLTFATGDYYLVGERDKPGAEPARLVRDFAINSREQLDQVLMYRPELRDRYVDVGLSYLPVSSAYALKAVLPIVTPSLSDRRFTPLVQASRLTAPMLKNSDIIYVGLLSGLALLEQPVFAGSRFAFGGSYDEIIDSKTGKIYVADPPQEGESAHRNYAYIALLPGPTGNKILIVAGTRDPAVLQAADILTNPELLAKLAQGSKDGYFEALYAVEGVGGDNLRGTLIAAAPRSVEGMWDALSTP